MMKPTTTFFRQSFFTSALFAALLLSSCNQKETKEGETAEVADSVSELTEDRNEAKFDDKQMKDADFMTMASEANLLEIQLGKLAGSNAFSPEVKKLGKMLEQKHAQAQAELKDLAGKKQVSLAAGLSSDGLDLESKMKATTGKAFDDEYCSHLVKMHEEAVEAYEKASLNAEDPDLKKWAASMLPELRKHLDAAITCQKKTGDNS